MSAGTVAAICFGAERVDDSVSRILDGINGLEFQFASNNVQRSAARVAAFAPGARLLKAARSRKFSESQGKIDSRGPRCSASMRLRFSQGRWVIHPTALPGCAEEKPSATRNGRIVNHPRGSCARVHGVRSHIPPLEAGR